MSISELSPGVWTALLLSGLFAGMGKAGFGGIGMLSLLLMAQVFPPRESTGILLPMLIVADVFAVWKFRQFTVWKFVIRLAVPAAVGVVFGWWMMPWIPTEIFGKLIGGMVLVLIVLLVVMRAGSSWKSVTMEHPGLFWPVGLLVGISTMIANAAGPISTLYLLASKLPKYEFVGTGAWFFLLINVFKVPFSASLGLITPATLLIGAVSIPAIMLGIFLGRKLLSKVSQQLFEILLLLFSAGGAVRLLSM